MSDGRATGVVTEAGDEHLAPLVISNLDAKTLMTRLVDPTELPEDYLRDLRGFRTFSTAFKINVACHRPPQYTAFDPAKAGFDYPTYVHIAPDIEYLERAYDDAKYGSWSKRPFVTPVVPDHPRRHAGPAGQARGQPVRRPCALRAEGCGLGRDRARQKLVDAVLDAIETFAPGWRTEIIDMQVLLAPDLERIVGLPQGHIFHGELAPDQVFFTRPAAHYADYRTPIRGLYVCGSSMHPGGGVSGIPATMRRARS